MSKNNPLQTKTKEARAIVDSKGPAKDEVLKEKEAELVKESSAAYLLDEPQLQAKYRQEEQERDLRLVSSAQLAATSQDDPIQQHYFEKYIDQRMANIDEKFVSIQKENELMRQELRSSVAQIQRSLDQNLTQMQERDNQRHAEMIATLARFDQYDARFQRFENKIDTRFDQFEANVNARFDHSEARANEKFDQIDARFEHVNERFNQFEARFDRSEAKVDARFDHFETRINEKFEHSEAKVVARFNKFEASFDRFEAKMDQKFERSEAKVDARFNQFEAKVDSRFNRLDEKVDTTNKWMIGFVFGALLTLAGILFSNFWALYNLMNP